MASVDLAGFGMVFAVLAALAVLVKYERRLSRWLVKSPRRRRRKAAGLVKPALL
jgi:Na+-transporting methylmalonyl-CoA/oxaloacetate decarboxylase gamma subunit